MAADFHLRYPVGGPYTVNWDPSVDPLVDGSDIKRHSGIVADHTTDPAVQYSYRLGDPWFEYTYLFRLPHGDQVLLDGFEDAVGGADFEFKDGELSDYGVACFSDETLKQRVYSRTESALNRKLTIVLLVKDLPIGS